MVHCVYHHEREVVNDKDASMLYTSYHQSTLRPIKSDSLYLTVTLANLN